MEYLAPNVQTIAWPGLHALPLTPSNPGGTIIILDLPSIADMAIIARLYPSATFGIYTASGNLPPIISGFGLFDDITGLDGFRLSHVLSDLKEA